MRLLAKVADWVAIVAGWSLLFLSIIVCAEVISRKFFSFSFQAADELGGYILAISSVAGFAAALISRAHTRVDIVWVRFPERVKAALNVLALAALSGFAIFMAMHAWRTMSQSYRLGSRSFTPLQTHIWIPQAIWFVGLTFFAVVAVIVTVLAIRASLRNAAEANTAYGPLSTEGTENIDMDGLREADPALEASK